MSLSPEMEFIKAGAELARITPTGEVVIDWDAVRKVEPEDKQLYPWCVLMLAVKDGTWKSMDAA